MRFAAPAGLAALALAVPLVAWYVLRARRPRVVVASTLLWRGAERPVAAAVPWQRFRPDRTFWLVLAALIAGALALARPAIPVEAELGDHTILVVDASASMLAEEDGQTRLDLARAAAADTVADLGPGQTASVVEAGLTGRVLLSGSGDPAAARRALGEVRPTDGSADLADAFTLAAALHEPGERTVTHLITDGAVPDAHRAAAPADLRVHALGSDRPNLAVTRVEAVTTGGGSAQVFAQIRNFGLTDAGARVAVAIDGAELVRRSVALGPRAAEDLVFAVPVGRGAGLVEVGVEPRGSGPGGEPAEDALWVDDVARAVLAGPRQVNALVVGEASAFVVAALEALDGVDVRTAAAVPDDLAGTDLLVIDRADSRRPEATDDVPPVPTIYLAPTRPPPGVDLADDVETPAVTFQAPDHPVLADVDLAGLAIARARPAAAPALERLVAGPDGALVLAGRLDATPVVYLAFDLSESNLPLRVAWPVLVANAVTWLTAPPAVAPLMVGDEATVTPPPGVEAVAVTAPDGAELVLDSARPRLTVDRLGVWQAGWVGPDDVVAAAPPPPLLPVNAPADEGDLARPRPPPGEPLGTEGRGADPGGTVAGERTFGRELLALALGLLLADGALRHRRRDGRGARQRRGRPRRRRADRREPPGGGGGPGWGGGGGAVQGGRAGRAGGAAGRSGGGGAVQGGRAWRAGGAAGRGGGAVRGTGAGRGGGARRRPWLPPVDTTRGQP